MEQDIYRKKYLKLIRFCGEEFYPIKSAKWHFSESEDEGASKLWLDIQADYGQQLSEDTQTLNGQPHWELTIPLNNSSKVDNLNGRLKTEIKDGYDEEIGDYVTNFYYCEHEKTENNQIEIIERIENRLLIRLTGEVTDINFCDGSKPKNKIFVETWFEED